ncbi:8293_t:CDS:2 [Ambispora leptoticha]|uniref:8293_t:CDS:1 n=1 Tax=Ambispora leptoticha TaxID=144679 RepID=A0A9N9AMV5_9GLOM|nr:8293_t:CDS:2 [Ambispora leptoticha]
MSPPFLTSLSNDFGHLLDEGDDYNVIVHAGEEPNDRTFLAHSVVLRARSPYFRRALSKEWARTEKNGMIVFKKPNISHSVFQIILKYMYTGTIALDFKEGTELLKLLVAADELFLQELHDHVQSHLLECREVWLCHNFALVHRTVFQLEASKELQSFFRISSADFYNRVRPFKEILQTELFEAIEKFHFKAGNQLQSDNLLPARFKGIKSTIIEEKHASLIASWIDGGDSVSSKDSNKISRVIPRNAHYAVNDSQDRGPCFGDGDLWMNDMFNQPDSCTCNRDSYDQSIGDMNRDSWDSWTQRTGSFQVEDYEVFQVVKKRPRL